jgi:hypothetical protein
VEPTTRGRNEIGWMSQGQHGRELAQSPEVSAFSTSSGRDGHLYDFEQWIADGNLLQLAPDTIPKGTRLKKRN